VIEALPFAAILASAFLHAAWNAIARRGSEPGDAFAAAVFSAGLVSLPGLAMAGPPALAAMPYLAFGIVMNTIAVRLSMAAYRRGSYALAYPAMRAGIPLIAMPLAAILLAEWPSPVGAIGVLLIGAALALLAFAARRAGRGELKGLGFALAAAAISACHTATDAIGIRASGNILGYGFLLTIGNASLLVVISRLEGRSPVALYRAHAGLGLRMAMISMTSYLLYIWVVSTTPVAIAAALRETSVLFAVGLAALFLKERIGAPHIVAAILAVAGVMAIRLG
jgi:drug/metabolite transporter (DMT)-like permease